MPWFYNIFDFVLTRENCLSNEEYLVRDIGVLMDGKKRSRKHVICIDTNNNSTDPMSPLAITIPFYDGSGDYSNLDAIHKQQK